MPSPKPVSTEREIRLKYTKATVLDALGLTPGGRDSITLSINQYGELLVTVTHPTEPPDDDLAPRAPKRTLEDYER